VRSRPASTLRSAPAAFQRPAPITRWCNPSAGVCLTRHHRGFIYIHPSALPQPVIPGWNGSPWASTSGFAPRSCPRRTPRRGQAVHTGLGPTPSTSVEPPWRLPLNSSDLASQVLEGNSAWPLNSPGLLRSAPASDYKTGSTFGTKWHRRPPDGHHPRFSRPRAGPQGPGMTTNGAGTPSCDLTAKPPPAPQQPGYTHRHQAADQDIRRTLTGVARRRTASRCGSWSSP
jgi:hypothetical protein